MKRPFFKSTNFVILSGLILTLFGFAGMMISNRDQPRNIDNITYRLLILENQDKVGRGESFTFELPTQVNVQGKDLIVKPEIIYIGEAYIHVNDKPEIENPLIPTKIAIPSISLEAPVVSADFHHQKVEGDYFGSWEAPEFFAAGWHPDSALLGKVGNTVINGHHNSSGMVFQHLVDVGVGDRINVYADDEVFTFVVSNRMILPELFVNVETRLENARWLAKSDDTRLTLVTCWPADSNTHRLIIVAVPLYEN